VGSRCDARREQVGDGPASRRVHEGGADLRQRFQYEPTLSKARVRQDEAWIVGNDVAEENQVEIERSSGIWIWALAAAVPLDCQEALEQLARRQSGDADCGRVEEPRSAGPHVDGRGFDVGRNAKGREKLRELPDRIVEMRLAVA